MFQKIDKILLQIEKSPTLGSIETPDYEKRLLATQSLEYNLKDSMFCELFPDTVSVNLLFSYTNNLKLHASVHLGRFKINYFFIDYKSGT